MGLELWQIAGLHQWGELLVQSGRIPEEEESEEEDAPEEYADHQEDEECRCWNCGTTCFWDDDMECYVCPDCYEEQD